MAGPMAIVESHVPEWPAGEGLYDSPWNDNVEWGRVLMGTPPSSSSSCPEGLGMARLASFWLSAYRPCWVGRQGGTGRCCPSAPGCRLPAGGTAGG